MFDLNNINNFDERSVFANWCCGLLFKVYGDLDGVLASEDLQLLHKHCETNLRNVYELIGREIPLLGLYEMSQMGFEDYFMTEVEFAEHKLSYIEGCKILFNL